MRRDDAIDPQNMDLDTEVNYLQSTTRNTRRVKLQRGESVLLRFLPAQLGPKRLWYARIGRHWYNRKPVYCPVHTSPDYGGDPDGYCPVCEAVDRLEQHDSKEIQDEAFKARGTANWLTYCLVFKRAAAGVGAKAVSVPPNELLHPWQFDHYRSTFEELMVFYRNAVKSDNPKSILDLRRGCDFWVNKTTKGTRLDRQEAVPIFDDLEEVAESDPRIVKILEECRTPRIVMPTEKELARFAEQMEEGILMDGRESRGSRRGGDDDDHEDRRGRRREELDDEDQVPGAEMPQARRSAPRPAAPPAPAPAPRAAGPRTAPARAAVAKPEPEPEPEPEQEPEAEAAPEAAPEAEATPEAEDAPEVEVAVERTPARTAPVRTAPAAAPRPASPAPVPRAASAAPARPAPAPAAARPAPSARPAPAPARPVSRASTAAAPAPRGGDKIEDDPAELPEESRELVTPAEEPLPESGETAPPPVQHTGSISSRLRERIASVTKPK